MFGKLLGSAVRIVNAPLSVADRLIDADDSGERALSAPLEMLAEELDEADDDE